VANPQAISKTGNGRRFLALISGEDALALFGHDLSCRSATIDLLFGN
jgi:hypothetical protein